MARVVDVVAIVVALGFAAIGIWRGFLRELVVLLAGVVLGAMMGSLWGEFWARQLATRIVAKEETLLGVILLGLLCFVILFIGYGSGFFLSRPPLKRWHRAAGGGVGLLNGLLMEAFFFRYVQDYFVTGRSALSDSYASTVLTKWFSWVFLGLVLAVGLTVAVIALVRLARFIMRLAQPPAEAAAAAPAAPAAPSAPTSTPTAAPPPPEAAGPTVPCPNCRTQVPVGSSYCPNCGKIIS